MYAMVLIAPPIDMGQASILSLQGRESFYQHVSFKREEFFFSPLP
jgi:hypothetical protein